MPHARTDIHEQGRESGCAVWIPLKNCTKQHQARFVGGGPCARINQGKADATTPVNGYAYEMNFEPLNEQHGAPLRLRVENQLGFKMVKWIRAIEFVESVESIGKGEGGYNEDNEYFGELANI